MKKVLLTIYCSLLSIIAFGQSKDFTPQLLGTASIDADTFVDGPTSGQFISGGDYTRATETYSFSLPFENKQPLQGISAIIDGPVEGTYYIMQDNGFGGRSSSPDALLHVYAVKINWTNNTVTPVNFKTGEELSGFSSESYIRLSDPYDSLTYETVCEMTNYPTTTTADNSTVAVDQDIIDNHWLTGYDLDIESMRQDSEGNFWFGEEFGPFLIKTNSEGAVIKHEIRIPNNTGLGDNDYIETSNTPYTTTNANLGGSGGIEGMALNTSKTKLYTIFEKNLSVDDSTRRRFINVFDLNTEAFESATYQYRVDTQYYHNASGDLTEENLTINDFTAINDTLFMVMEKDRGAGDYRTGNFSYDYDSRVAVRKKCIYKVNINSTDNYGFLNKTLVANLVDIEDTNSLGGDNTINDVYTFPMECVEAIHLISDTSLIVANDNNYPGGSPSRLTTQPDDNEFACIQFTTLTSADSNTTNIVESIDNDIVCFPNPCKDNLTVKSDYNIESVTLLNSSGITISRESNLNSKSISLTLSNLSGGVYFVNIVSNSKNITKKILKY